MTDQESNTNARTPASKPDSQWKVGVTIDHRFFPHIIDSIFAALSYPGLVNCASVCTDWRERATPRLSKHVALFEDTTDGSTKVLSRDLRWPDKSAVLVSTACARSEALLLAATSTVVDRHYKGPEYDTLSEYSREWPTAFYRLPRPQHTGVNGPLRRRKDSLSGKLGWGEIVHFLHYSGGEFGLAADCAINPWTLTLTIDCYSNPTLPEKSLTSAPSAFSVLASDSLDVEEFTVIFKSRSHLDSPFDSPFDGALGSDLVLAALRGERESVECRVPELGAACEFLVRTTNCRANRIEVVGLDTFVPTEDLFSYLHRLCENVGLKLWPKGVPDVQGGVPCIGNRLKFFTHSQYRGMVGEGRYRLLTTQ